MSIYNFCLIFAGLITLQAFAKPTIDQQDVINGVSVISHKTDSLRTYVGTVKKTLPSKIENVTKSIVNFHEKCNNSYKDKRQDTNKNENCRYHNDNVVETVVIKNINQSGWTKDQNETERYILGRRVYNRSNFQYYELVKIYEYKNDKNQKMVKITQTMLNDKEVNNYIKPQFDKDSAFNAVTSTYVLTEVAPSTTNLEYEYYANTDHWVLNKEVSVPQVFSSMSKGINDLLKSVDAETVRLCRDVASN